MTARGNLRHLRQNLPSAKGGLVPAENARVLPDSLPDRAMTPAQIARKWKPTSNSAFPPAVFLAAHLVWSSGPGLPISMNRELPSRSSA
jgi:hypothetical protein